MAPAENRDSRFDRAVSWALTTVAGLAFSIGAWTFSGLKSEVHEVSQAISKIDTRLAVVEGMRVQDEKSGDRRVTAIEHRLDLIEGKK